MAKRIKLARPILFKPLKKRDEDEMGWSIKKVAIYFTTKSNFYNIFI